MHFAKACKLPMEVKPYKDKESVIANQRSPMLYSTCDENRTPNLETS
jgi:hypothetical protein